MGADLSFNRIKKIEGLESLQKLELLELSNNRISAIENMDTLENLTHFAIANNLISEISNVMYLRRFKKLYQVYFFGNPISEEDAYVMFIVAFLPTLRGLDKICFDKKTKEKACADYKSTLDKLELEELQKQQDAEAQMRKEAELKSHKDAFVESFNGPCMFKSMFEDDPEAARLSCIPGMASHLQEYPFFPLIFLVHVAVFLTYSANCHTFDQCRDLEKDYHLKVQQTAVATLEKVAQGNLEEDEPDEVAMLLKDTNAVMSALATSHDNHLLKIRDWETCPSLKG
ncbi:dynein regulatory complex subunit 3-like [Cololabis saira]|uniref:dynein regulatory complex subunit 3-like n=1 Tax=Cololabis saira TaxID=129043 RepID=UPI002AD2EEE0|nr:dynein regulatory complex subunit 3-like [Cololabis saira]